MPEYKQMTLKQCGQHDHANKARESLTGWGKICKQRQEAGISRKARIQRRKQGK